MSPPQPRTGASSPPGDRDTTPATPGPQRATHALPAVQRLVRAAYELGAAAATPPAAWLDGYTHGGRDLADAVLNRIHHHTRHATPAHTALRDIETHLHAAITTADTGPTRSTQ